MLSTRFFSQSLLTWRVATNAKEVDLAKLFSALLSNFLQSILTKSMSTNVTFYALSSAVTGIDVRSKIREMQLET